MIFVFATLQPWAPPSTAPPHTPAPHPPPPTPHPPSRPPIPHAGSDLSEVLDVCWANDDPNPKAIMRVKREREETFTNAYMDAGVCVCGCVGGVGGGGGGCIGG